MKSPCLKSQKNKVGQHDCTNFEVNNRRKSMPLQKDWAPASLVLAPQP